MRSVRTSHLLLSSEISSPSSARVSARSLMGSPRCDFTLIRKVALSARTRCVSRQTISCRMSATGAVASVALPPCPTHFLIAHKTVALSHSSRTSSTHRPRKPGQRGHASVGEALASLSLCWVIAETTMLHHRTIPRLQEQLPTPDPQHDSGQPALAQ